MPTAPMAVDTATPTTTIANKVNYAQSCKKVKQQKKLNGRTYVCQKKSKKLQWLVVKKQSTKFTPTRTS
jgi:hypothetical protein